MGRRCIRQTWVLGSRHEARAKGSAPLRLFLICSDRIGGRSGAPGRSPLTACSGGNLSSPRLFDVAGDQIRRVAQQSADRRPSRPNARRRCCLRIGQLRARGWTSRTISLGPSVFYDRFQTDETGGPWPCSIRPTSGLFPASSFDGLARHGFEIADATLTTYVRRGLPEIAYLLGGPVMRGNPDAIPRPITSDPAGVVVLVFSPRRAFHDDRGPADGREPRTGRSAKMAEKWRRRPRRPFCTSPVGMPITATSSNSLIC